MNNFLQTLIEKPETIDFNHTMAVIDKNYDFTPSAFKNADTENKSGENNGSCKLFAFAKLQGLDEQQTLDCFGQYYRNDVLKYPEGSDHQNIRNFMKTGWSAIVFEQSPLILKTS
ncbi:MAG: HopJ type III effector protein [Pseudomonadota bacterium]